MRKSRFSEEKMVEILREAAVLIEACRIHYNAVRPHISLGYLTPNEFKQQHHPQPQPAIF